MPPLPVQYPHVCVCVRVGCCCFISTCTCKDTKRSFKQHRLEMAGVGENCTRGGLEPLFQPTPHPPLPPPMRALKSGHFVRPVCAPKMDMKGTENGAAPHGTNVDPKCTN